MKGFNRGTIRYMWEKLKGELATDRTFYAVLVVLVGVSAFALGRYSVSASPMVVRWGGGESAVGAVSLAYTNSEAALVATSTLLLKTESAATGAFVASRSGTKYHDVHCSSAARISEANRIYFATVADARAAGYTPAANCPLLTP